MTFVVSFHIKILQQENVCIPFTLSVNTKNQGKQGKNKLDPSQKLKHFLVNKNIWVERFLIKKIVKTKKLAKQNSHEK